MTTIRHADGAFFALGATPDHAGKLADLGWRRHPHDMNAWWTRSPYLAAPLWRHVESGDAATTAALQPYAWNYETSFAREPLAGTGCDAIRLPVGETPYPFQIAGVQRGMLRKKVMIADPMGLGKSCQALAMMNLLRPKRTLIGCPTFLTKNWAAEAQRWLVDAQPITILDGAKKSLPDAGVIILPYSRGHTFVEQIKAGPPIDFLVMDEVHFLKGSSRRAAAWLGDGGLARRAERVIALSGTPMPNNPIELYSLLDVLAPELMRGVTRTKFQELYCNTIPMKVKVATKQGDKQIKVEKVTAKGTAVLNAELRASGVMIRRNKDEVLPQLPPKHVSLLHLTPDAEIEHLVREESDLYEQLQMRVMTSQELMILRGHVARVRAQLGLLKAPKIAEYVKHILDSGEDRVVLFMLHLEAIEAVRRSFEGTGVEALILTGAETPSLRQERVNAFQKPGGRKVIIGQTTAAGVGLTMTAARFVVLGEISWTPAWNDQATDRVHRIGQTDQVECIWCTFPHAVEARVLNATARKSIDAAEILDVNLQKMLVAA